MKEEDRFLITRDYSYGGYRVTIPRYEGGEVVRAWAYDAAVARITALENALRESAVDVHKIGAYHNPASVPFEECQRASCVRYALAPLSPEPMSRKKGR